MKAIKVLIVLLVVTALSCNDDDDSTVELNRFESGQNILELQLESYSLSIQKKDLLEQRELVLQQLSENPQDQILLSQLDLIETDLVSVVDLEETVGLSIVSLGGVGPIPPLPPCFDPGPLENCFFPITNLESLFVQNNLSDFELTIIDPNTEEELFTPQEFSESEIDQSLNEYPIDLGNLNLPDFFIILVNKIENGVDRSYSLRAAASSQ